MKNKMIASRKRLRRAVRRRVKDTSGASLGEMLMTVLLLLISTSILAAVVSMGVRTFVKTLSYSEADVLSSTLQAVMTDELAYTTEVHVSGSNVTSFQSQHYAMKDNLSTFFISDDSQDDYGYGKVMIGTADSSYKLLGDGSYPHDLGVKIREFTYDKTTGIFTIEIGIGRKGAEYLDQTFQVVSVNTPTVSG